MNNISNTTACIDKEFVTMLKQVLKVIVIAWYIYNIVYYIVGCNCEVMWWYVQQFCCSAVSVDSGDEFGDDVGEHCDCVIFITIEDDFCCGGCFTFFSFHHSITLCAL